MQETSEWYGDDDWAVDGEAVSGSMVSGSMVSGSIVSDEIAEDNNNANDRTNAERQRKRHDGGT